MSDLIDRQALLKELMDGYNRNCAVGGEFQLVADGIETAIGIVEDAPAVDVTAVHGRLVASDTPCEKFKCSVCGGGAWYYDYQGDVIKSRYCPNCGVKMDSEVKS